MSNPGGFPQQQPGWFLGDPSAPLPQPQQPQQAPMASGGPGVVKQEAPAPGAEVGMGQPLQPFQDPSDALVSGTGIPPTADAAAGAGAGSAVGSGVAADSSHPVARVIAAFQPFTTIPLESIPVEPFCAASVLIVPLYHILFGGEGTVSRTLSADVSSHIDEIRAASRLPGAPQQLLALLQWEATPVASGGAGRNDMELRKGWSATHGLLWVLRAERLVSRLAQLLADPSQSARSPTDLARQSYSEVLKPYHGVMVGGIVKLAFGFVPDRNRLQQLFGYPNLEQAYADLAILAGTMGAVAENLTQWFRSQGKDFPDKA